MKIKQQIELSPEEAEKILIKVIESKVKKKVTSFKVVEKPAVAGASKGETIYRFELEDGQVEDQTQPK